MGDFGYIFGYCLFFSFCIGGLVGFYARYLSNGKDDVNDGE